MTNHDDVTPCLKYLFDHTIPTPCFVIDEDRLKHNVKILDEVQQKSGAKILLALKSFAAWSVFPLLSRQKQGALWGTCASSVDEARLGKEEFGGEVHAFAAAWSDEEIHELLELADHIVFNSIGQWLKYGTVIGKANISTRKNNPIKCGLRVNPEHSEGAPAIYNPCDPASRLGTRRLQLKNASAEVLAGISGLHFHTLCEQGADALERTINVFDARFDPWIKNCSWLNFGGGHHITKPGYDRDLLVKLLAEKAEKHIVYIEPGEAVALDAGWLVATVLDIVQADMPVAILDISAACHMPDVLEMPYTPIVWHTAGQSGKRLHPEMAKTAGADCYTFRLAGKSCLAGDNIGEYSFPAPLHINEKIVFADMAIYSMVKTTTFNGLRLPSIAVFSSEGYKPRFNVIKNFTYENFKNRLS